MKMSFKLENVPDRLRGQPAITTLYVVIGAKWVELRRVTYKNGVVELDFSRYVDESGRAIYIRSFESLMKSLDPNITVTLLR